MAALFLGIYSAILSTCLAAITLSKFLSERRTISVEKRVSYSSGDVAHYTFVVTNVSARPLTIIDCMSMNLAQTPSDGLQPDWGVQPNKIERLFEDDSELFQSPYVIAPGGALLLNLDSNTLIEQYSDYARSQVRMQVKSTWLPTDQAVLEIYHSLDPKPFVMKFRLEKGEAQRAAKSVETKSAD